MATLKKDLIAELRTALMALKMPELRSAIESLNTIPISRSTDMSLLLTKFIVLQIIARYPQVMEQANNQLFRDFCAHKVGRISTKNDLTLSKNEQATLQQFFGSEQPSPSPAPKRRKHL